jgi:hypothetical protein
LTLFLSPLSSVAVACFVALQPAHNPPSQQYKVCLQPRRQLYNPGLVTNSAECHKVGSENHSFSSGDEIFGQLMHIVCTMLTLQCPLWQVFWSFCCRIWR